MNNQSNAYDQPYRIVRNHEGKKTYFAGHHGNGAPKWVEKQNDGVKYADVNMASTVRNVLTSESTESINVVRVSG